MFAIPETNDGRFIGRAALCLFLGVLLIVSVISAALAPKSLSARFMTLCVMIGLAACAMQLLYRATGPRPVNWLTLDILFIIPFCMIHFAPAIYWLLGLISSGDAVWYNVQVVPGATMMAVSGIVAFLLGFNLLPERYSRIHWPDYRNAIWLRKWKRAGTTLVFAGSLFFALAALGMGEGLAGGAYGTFDKPRVVLLRTLLLTGMAIATLASSQLSGKWKIGVFPKTIFFVFVFWALIVGDRSLAMTAIILVAAAYAEYIKHISFKRLLAGLMVAILLIGIVGAARKLDRRTARTFLQTAIEGERQWDAGITTLAGSARTLYAAVDTVPERYSYFAGKLYVSSIVGIVPYAQGLLFRYGIIPSPTLYGASDVFLTWIINRGDMHTGRGTTVVADIYLNFGYPGVIMVLLGLGLLFKHVQQRARATASLGWGIAHTFMAPWAAMASRYPLGMMIRLVIWPLLICVVIGKVLGLPRNVAIAPELISEAAER